MPSINDYYPKFLELSLEHYDTNEATLIAKMAAEFCVENLFSEKQTLELEIDLKNARPIQYIIGKAYFSDFELMVNEYVLIPRPETDELVHLIIHENKNNSHPIRILDIGTGSGCIAIALKKHLPNAIVTAIDISQNALNVAHKNAKKIGVEIDFKEQDILNNDWQIDFPFDIIVSNPPYITKAEKLAKNVMQEPNIALFVSDDDPLQFYKAIEKFSRKNLSKKGKVFMETHSFFAIETQVYWQENNWQTTLKKDMQGMDRILIANKKS